MAVLTALVIIVSLLPARLPGKWMATIPNIPILFSIVGLHGATAALLAAFASVVASGFIGLMGARRFQPKYYLPNISAHILAIGGGALLYSVLERMCFPEGGVQAGEKTDWRAWLALPVCALIAFVVNILIVTTLVSIYDGKRWDMIWHDNMRWMLPSAVFMSPVAFLTAMLYNQHWWLGVGFIIVPVYALRMTAVTHERTMAAYKQGVDLLGRIMQEAHPYTHGHLHRVARWAKRIAEDMNLPASSMQHIEDAAILHDIGKVAVDDRVLNKVGKLTDDDWAMIRRHPVTGADLVIKMSVLDKVSHWIRHHHERPDGKGYPDGLKEDEIPVESSIISVVDAFDAMVGGPAKEDQRPYRQPMSREDAIAELRRHAGTQFQAQVVEVFITILQREKELEDTGRHVAPKPGLADDSLWAAPPVSGALSLTTGG
jgi:putative nucleotidyltransferase with HDIG domain